VVSLDKGLYNWMRRTYTDNNTLNPGVLLEGDGTPDDAALAVARNVETADLWAKRYFDVATAMAVLGDIGILGRARLGGGSGAI
jgi:hypothetical protein